MKFILLPSTNKALAKELCSMVLTASLANSKIAIQAYLKYKKLYQIHNPELFKFMELEHESHFLPTKYQESESHG